MQERTYSTESTLAFLLVYLGLFSAAVLINLPGRANPDTVDILWQAQNPIQLKDWHSPFIAFVYGFLGPIFGYPSGALILQAAFLMLWPALIAVQIGRARLGVFAKSGVYLAWAIVCAFLIALAGQIVKDVLIVSFMSALFVLYPQARMENEATLSKRRAVCILIISTAIVLVRSVNYLIFIVCCAIVGLFLLHSRRGRIPQYAALAAASIAVLAAIFLSGWLFQARETNPERPFIGFDLAGISFYTNENLFATDRHPESRFKKQPVECYTPKQSNVFFWGDCSEYDLILRERKNLVGYWLSTIIEHPVSYIRHRLEFAAHLLTLDGSTNESLFPLCPPCDGASNSEKYINTLPGEYSAGLQMWRPSVTYIPFGVMASWLAESPLGHPLAWCLVLVLSLVGVYRSRVIALTPLLLSACGLSNVAVFVFFGSSDDLRYLLPTFFCALGAAVFWLGQVFRTRENVVSRSAPIGGNELNPKR